MAKPWIHAQSSAKKFGGKPQDYLEIHNLMDDSKATIGDNRHRALTHNAWFIGHIIERIKFSNSGEPTGDNRFVTIINGDGKEISVRDVAEQHVVEDYMGFIPSAQDFLQEMEWKPWMNNGNGPPPSMAKVIKKRKKVFIPFDKEEEKEFETALKGD